VSETPDEIAIGEVRNGDTGDVVGHTLSERHGATWHMVISMSKP